MTAARLRSRAFRFAVPVVSVAVALAAAAGLEPAAGRILLAPFYLAVIVSAWVCGSTAGTLATALGGVASAFLLARASSGLGVAEAVQLGLFLSISGVVDLFAALRERAESAGRESRLFAQAIADSSPSILFVFDIKEGRSLYINRAVERILGYTPEEIFAMGPSLMAKLIDPADADAVADRDRRIAAGGDGDVVETEYRMRRKDGAWRRMWSAASVFKRDLDGSPRSIIGAARDVTERYGAEERFRLAVESLPNAMLMVDADGAIAFVNAQGERLFGYARDELIGRPIELLVPERFRSGHPAFRRGFAADPQTRPMGAGRDLYGLRKDGSEVPIEIGLTPIRTETGTVVLSSIVDITERKRAEQARQELAHIARVATMGELTASLAHELQQPLAAIRANAGAGRRLLGEPDLDQVRDILAEIDGDAGRAGEIINRLRRLLRKAEVERARLDVNDLAADVIRLMQGDAMLRNVAIDVELAPGLPDVEGDRVQLQQVILNLGMNSLDAMRDVEPDARRLKVRTSGEDGAVVVAIVDSGCGVPEETIDRIFEPFFTTKSTGMGMGLSIARTIVEGHGGRLWAENNPGGGAAFFITLPPSP
jgi:PAS domain S-box-containing protein